MFGLSVVNERLGLAGVKYYNYISNTDWTGGSAGGGGWTTQVLCR